MPEETYRPPAAELNPETPGNGREGDGSLASALNGDYDFSIGELVGDAWRLVSGNKFVVWLGIIAFALVYGIAIVALSRLGLPDGQEAMAEGNFGLGMAQSIGQGFLLVPLIAPLTVGLAQLVIQRAGGDDEAGVGEVFGYFGQLPRLMMLFLIQTPLIYLGFILFLLPGIYLSVAYLYAPVLMIDKQLSPWQALEASRKSVTTHFFLVLGAGVSVYMLAALLSLTLVGIIWAAPFACLGYGLIYRRIFGHGPEAA